jgi:hypothetical protein
VGGWAISPAIHKHRRLAKVGFDRILVFAYDLETTEAISQGEVTIYTQEGPLFQGQTNSRGIAEFYLEPGVFSSSFSYGYDLPGDGCILEYGRRTTKRS